MNQQVHIVLLIIFFFSKVEAQSPPPNSADASATSSFRPSVAVVVGVLSIMFALTFLLLIYAKFCHTSMSDVLHHPSVQPTGVVIQSGRFSGIDKAVIESLPFFRFSSLRGSKEGLECAVCLSKFDETETLRLLPKCKHAFHVSCVDQWLEGHSTCPLCRLKIDPEDISTFMYSTSMRFSPTHSDLTEDPNLELFVRREPEDQGSSRFSVGSSFRKIENVLQEGSAVQESTNIYEDNSSDMLVNSAHLFVFNSKRHNNAPSPQFTSSNLTNAISSGHEKAVMVKEMEGRYEAEINRIDRSYSASSSNLLSANHYNSSRFVAPSEKRSMSEIINLSRFADHFGLKSRSNKESPCDVNGSKEEDIRRLWSPVARRTVDWFAGRERRSKQSQNSTQLSIV